MPEHNVRTWIHIILCLLKFRQDDVMLIVKTIGLMKLCLQPCFRARTALTQAWNSSRSRTQSYQNRQTIKGFLYCVPAIRPLKGVNRASTKSRFLTLFIVVCIALLLKKHTLFLQGRKRNVHCFSLRLWRIDVYSVLCIGWVFDVTLDYNKAFAIIGCMAFVSGSLMIVLAFVTRCHRKSVAENTEIPVLDNASPNQLKFKGQT